MTSVTSVTSVTAHDPQPPVRALVVGLGAIGQRHARNLRLLLGERLVLSALRSRRDRRVITDTLALTGDDPEADCDGGVFTHLDDALAAGQDVVLVCNPTRLHVPVARAAIQSGAAVFLEKPVSDDLADAVALRDEAAARGATVAVGCQLRFHPALQSLQRIIADGALGRLVAVHVEEGEYLPGWHPYEDYRTSYAARRELGGGVVLTQIHELDYVQWLFGVPDRLFAVGGTIGSLDIDVEDTASVLALHHVDGRPLAVHVHLDYLQRPPRRTCRVVGEEGTVELDLRAPWLRWTDAGGRVVRHDTFDGFARSTMFVDELAAFLDAAGGRRAPEVDLAHAVDTMRIAAAVRSALDDRSLQILGGEPR